MELFTVAPGWGAARRTAPRLEATKVGTIPAGTVVRLTKFTEGEVIGGNGIWYGDRSGWIWSGSFVERPQTPLDVYLFDLTRA